MYRDGEQGSEREEKKKLKYSTKDCYDEVIFKLVHCANMYGWCQRDEQKKCIQ